MISLIVFGISMPAKVFGIDLLPKLGGQRAGTSIYTFLKIGVGARAAGMGNAAVSLASDATSLYWNPASAAQLNSDVVTVAQTQWLADIDYSYFGYVNRINKNIFLGLSAGALYTDPMEVTTVYHPYGSGEYFNYGDMFIGLTFAQKMTDRFSYGFTVKYVEETLADLDMHSALFDLGTYYYTGFKSLRFCVSLVNFGTQAKPGGTYLEPLQEGGEKESDYALFSPPTEFRIGAAMNIVDREHSKLLLSFQLNHPVDNAENYVFGLEQNLRDLLFLRGGLITAQDERGLAFGGGVKFSAGFMDFFGDYSWSSFGVLGDVQKFQISMQLK